MDVTDSVALAQHAQTVLEWLSARAATTEVDASSHVVSRLMEDAAGKRLLLQVEVRATAILPHAILPDGARIVN